MDQTRVDFFQVVGFFADVFDLVDVNVSSLQQSDGLLTTRISSCVGTLRLERSRPRLPGPAGCRQNLATVRSGRRTFERVRSENRRGALSIRSLLSPIPTDWCG